MTTTTTPTSNGVDKIAQAYKLAQERSEGNLWSNVAGAGLPLTLLAGAAGLTPLALAGGAAGGLGGALSDDPEDKRSAGEKAVRGAATGAITGIGAGLGGALGTAIGAYGDNPGIGAGLGTLGGGALGYFLARRKKKQEEANQLDKAAADLDWDTSAWGGDKLPFSSMDSRINAQGLLGADRKAPPTGDEAGRVTNQPLDGQPKPPSKLDGWDMTKHYLGSTQGLKDLGGDYMAAMKRGHLGALAGTAGAASAAGLLAYMLMRNKKKTKTAAVGSNVGPIGLTQRLAEPVVGAVLDPIKAKMSPKKPTSTEAGSWGGVSMTPGIPGVGAAPQTFMEAAKNSYPGNVK
jgi:hypothetical protein